MHRRELLALLAAHQTRFMEEQAYLRKAIAYIQAHENVFDRALLPGHVTGSAWVVNPRRDHVLLLHHKKLDRWFQPGGHADGDADIRRVCLKETAEETGIDPGQIRMAGPAVFDLDIHTVPARGSEPRHEHIDVRFLLEIDDRIPIPGNDESHEILWTPLHQACRYNRNLSTHRMIEKTRRMRHS